MEGRYDGGGELKVARDHTAQFAHITSNCPQLGRGALHEDHFKRFVARKVDVERGDHFIDVAALQYGQALLQTANCMVVEQGDGADHHVVAHLTFRIDERAVDEVRNCLRSALESALSDDMVEIGEKFFRQ
jgi:hypothetical protein